MRLRALGCSVLIVLPLLVCAGQLHAKRAAGPDAMRDVNRCLSIVRVATARRRKASQHDGRERHATAGVRTASAPKVLPPLDLRSSA